MKRLLFISLLLLTVVSASGQLLRHNMLKGHKSPVLITGQLNPFSTTTPIAISLAGTPREGALMIVVMGSNQNRDYTISGWTHAFNGASIGGNMHVFWKIAGAGESSTVNVGWTGGGTGQGCTIYYEFAGGAGVLASTVVSTTTATTHQWGAHDVKAGVVEIQLNHKGDGAQTWAINDGYAIGTSGGARTNAAIKTYEFQVSGVNPTWTYSTTAVANMLYVHVFGH